MSEVFYGPWHITVYSKDAYFSQRFTITGSDASDGTYPGVPGTGPGDVAGSQWTIDFEWNDNSSVAWHPSDSRRTVEYTVSDGLVVYAGVDDNFDSVRDYDYNDVVLRCVNIDPDINPFRGTVPYDFTISREQLERYRRDHPDDKDPKLPPKDDQPRDKFPREIEPPRHHDPPKRAD
jgi:hypothetical protein